MHAGLAAHAGLAVPRGHAAGIQGVQGLVVTAAGHDRLAGCASNLGFVLQWPFGHMG